MPHAENSFQVSMLVTVVVRHGWLLLINSCTVYSTKVANMGLGFLSINAKIIP